MILEKMQYRLIYYLYKTKYYKVGKGYIYRANQIFGILFGLLSLLPMYIFEKQLQVSNTSKGLIFICVALLFFYFFEMNVSRKKLLKNRKYYR
jgi:hypothetical protein